MSVTITAQHHSSLNIRASNEPFTTRRKRHFPYKNCLTVALRRQIQVRIQVIQLCWLWSVQCTLVQRRQAAQHRTDYSELVPQQHSLSAISLKPFLPSCGSGCINQVLYAPLFLLKSSFHLLYINKRENTELCLFSYVSIIFFPIDQLEQLFVYFKNLLFPRDKFSICDSYLVSNIKLH